MTSYHMPSNDLGRGERRDEEVVSPCQPGVMGGGVDSWGQIENINIKSWQHSYGMEAETPHQNWHPKCDEKNVEGIKQNERHILIYTVKKAHKDAHVENRL